MSSFQKKKDIIDWFKTNISSNNPNTISALEKCLLLCWQIWDSRNNWIFKQITPHPAKVIHSAAAIGPAYWAHNPRVLLKDSSSALHIKWHPPRPNTVKLNFDGSVDPNHNATCGFVIRDELGSPLLAGSKNIRQASVTVAEARAVRDAMCSTLQKNFSKI